MLFANGYLAYESLSDGMKEFLDGMIAINSSTKADVTREDRGAFMLADELGFVEGLCGEHVTDRAENIASCAIFLASLVDKTKTMKLSTGIINMPNTHPASHPITSRANTGTSTSSASSFPSSARAISPSRCSARTRRSW